MNAVISECGQYRYRLDRDVQFEGVVIAYFGVNCSTADATENDQTVNKWTGFAKINNCKRFIVGNPFAFRSTDVKNLSLSVDPVGPENNKYIDEIISEADILIPCWGNITKVPKQLRHHFTKLKNKLFDSGKPIKIFGLTKSGDPKHPLMLGYKTELIKWHQ